jgi:hypothetical protein
MRTDLKSRLGRASAAIAVGIVALTGAAATADAHDWRYSQWRHHHHWNNGWAVRDGYYPYYNRPYYRSWDRGWTWRERYRPAPYGYYAAPSYGYYYAPPVRSYW